MACKLRLEGRVGSMLAVMLGGNLDVTTQVSDQGSQSQTHRCAGLVSGQGSQSQTRRCAQLSDCDSALVPLISEEVLDPLMLHGYVVHRVVGLGLGLGGVRARGTYFHKLTHSASIHNKCTQITSLVGCR